MRTAKTILERSASIDDLLHLAQKRVPKFAFDFMAGGAGSERGLRRNAERLAEVLLKPRYAVGVAPDTTTRLFGQDYALPFGIAPVGMGNAVWPGADLALAAQAEAWRIPYVLSTAASSSIAAITTAAPSCTWFQLYVSRNREISSDLMRRARDAGIGVLVVTIDIPVPGKRNRDIRNGFSLPFRRGPRLLWDVLTHPRWLLATLRAGSPTFENLAPYSVGSSRTAQSLAQFMAEQIKGDLVWDDLRAIRDAWPGRLVIKGLIAPEDAVIAAGIGADGLWISNHGGRQLDAAPAAIDALAAVRAVVDTRIPLFMDGGIRSGEDIAKARAMGATMAFSARCFYGAVAAGGGKGGGKAVAVLADELRRVLGQIGCPAVQDLDDRWLWP